MARLQGLIGRHPALYGYLLSGLVFTLLIYALLFHVRQDAIHGCERGNLRAYEMNLRVPVINTLVRHERAEGHDSPTLYPVNDVHVADCEAAYDKPWPFG